jgi:hypothetical protein
VTAPAQRDDLPSPDEVIAEIESGAAVPSERTRRLVADEAPAASVPATTENLGFDRRGNVIPATNEHGLPMEIAKEMHASADGYDAQLFMMQNSAAKVLQDMPPHFVEHFETLSEGIKVKAFRAPKAYPHLGVHDLIDKIQPTLTLSEMAEVQAWIKGLKR